MTISRPVDLRSDTVTQPSAAMRKFMAQAVVGDDAYGEDPTVRELEAYAAELFAKPAAVFMPSGTMSNQAAVRAHTRPGDEVLTESRYHVSYFEACQCADLARVFVTSVRTENGLLGPVDLLEALGRKPRGASYSVLRLAVVENTISGLGGKVFPLPVLSEFYACARDLKVKVHLDGARIFNASLAEGVPCSVYGSFCDSISACFAKGLAAPFGSVLCGPADFIEECRLHRKWYGGAFHQLGFMAAAALFALKHNRPRLEEDHFLARLMGELLEQTPGIRVNAHEIETNMVMIDISELGISSQAFADLLKQRGVLLFPWCEQQVRAVTHIGIEEEDILFACRVIKEVIKDLGVHSFYKPGGLQRADRTFLADGGLAV